MRKPILYASFVALFVASSCKTTYQNKQNQTVQFPSFSAEAHRGGRGLMPENTIEAMKYALSLDKLTTLEMDTQITKDGQVVVAHDLYINPGFSYLDGKEIPKADAKKYSIFGLTYAELRKFDVGSKTNVQFPRKKNIKTQIPLLADLIDAVQKDIKDNKRKQFFYNIETKCSEKGDGKTNPTPDVFVKLLMDVIEKKNITPYVVIQSFDLRTLRIIHQKYPHVKTSLLISNKKSYEENIAELGFKPFIYSVEHKIVTAELVKKAHADGVKILPWTPNEASEINALKALKVDGIITDYPDLF
jgi:glycerophosphoryl diester phosphodiesterase